MTKKLASKIGFLKRTYDLIRSSKYIQFRRWPLLIKGVDRRIFYALAIGLGMAGFWYISEASIAQAYVAKEEIPKGTWLTPMMFELVKVRETTEWMVSERERQLITGTYSQALIGKREFANKRELDKTPIVTYSQGEGTIGVKAIDQETVVGWQLEKGDLVSIAVFDRDKKETQLVSELTNIVVDSLVNREGQDIAYTLAKDRKEVSTVNLKVTPLQAKLIDEFQKKGSITLIRQVRTVKSP